jgi:hypothetical protein
VFGQLIHDLNDPQHRSDGSAWVILSDECLDMVEVPVSSAKPPNPHVSLSI